MALAGIALVATGGSATAVLAFGAVMGVVMGVEIAYLLRRYYVGATGTPWVVRASADEPSGPLAPATGPAAGR
jgi:hypothetical protein